MVLNMVSSKADIIARLKKDILPLQGFKTVLSNTDINEAIGIIRNAFPNNRFPLGAMHEFISENTENAAVTASFTATILSSLMANGGVALWIGTCDSIFPPALKSFGITPDKIIFIHLQKEKEILWVIEEALKCESLSAVIAQINNVSFTASRRLQLAVEQSGVTGFILRQNPHNINTIACIARWRITSLSSIADDMPGVGFPCWNVELLKVRNGKPSSWQIECVAGRLRHVNRVASIPELIKKKTG
jgi:protein ImuA